MTSNRLFSRGSLSEKLRSYREGCKNAINSLSHAQFEDKSDEELINMVFNAQKREPLQIFPDEKRISKPEEVIYNHTDSIELILEIPFIGDAVFWHYRPNRYTTKYPSGNIKSTASSDKRGILEVVLYFYQSNYKPDYVAQEINERINILEEWIGYVNRDVDEYNQDLITRITHGIRRRREKLNAIYQTTEQLNIPLKPVPGTQSYEEIPVRKKKVSPVVTKKENEKAYAISEAGYINILQLVRHIGASFERTPATFNIHGEEELRDIILAFLNGYFEGRAGGETFRKKGKTDICIEEENRAAFIAECKIWHGNNQAKEALDQLLGYATWRDVKTSLIFFNTENKGFSRLQKSLPNALMEHLKFIREFDDQPAGEWRFEFQSESDEDRMMTVHVFLIDLYLKG